MKRNFFKFLSSAAISAVMITGALVLTGGCEKEDNSSKTKCAYSQIMGMGGSAATQCPYVCTSRGYKTYNNPGYMEYCCCNP